MPKLRRAGFVRAFRDSLRQASTRPGFRVVHYSIQEDHVHLIVEAAGKTRLANGMKSVGARFARCVNRTFGRRGAVLKERFHHVVKRTPTEVRRALAYVLLNVRKHYRQRRKRIPPVVLEVRRVVVRPVGAEGRRRRVGMRIAGRAREVAEAGTWLLDIGWRQIGLIDPAEVPGG